MEMINLTPPLLQGGANTYLFLPPSARGSPPQPHARRTALEVHPPQLDSSIGSMDIRLNEIRFFKLSMLVFRIGARVIGVAIHYESLRDNGLGVSKV